MKRDRHGRASPLWGKDNLVIERMSQEGRGVATRHGKVVFVSGALAGEQVRVQCTLVKRDYDEADMLELVADSPPAAQRVAPQCPLYGECGGCSLQHWSPEAQLQHKQANLLRVLRNIAPVALAPPLTSRADGFRHRLRLMVIRQPDRRYVLGLRRRRSHDAIAVTHCLIANDAVNALLRELPSMLQAVPELQGLREIEIDADSSCRLGLCFHFAAHPGEALLSALRAAVLRAPVLSDAVVALRVRLMTPSKPNRDASEDDNGGAPLDNGRDLLVDGELCHLSATSHYPHEIAAPALSLAYLPGDFTQTHWDINAALVSHALDWLRPLQHEHALDLFCGIGNFSLPLARHVHTVHALEGDAGMTARVADNALRNALENVRARTLNLLAPEVRLPQADIAILDPPRAGAKAVCEALARSRVKRVLYISCHPATLARDAAILQKAGLRLTRAAAADMFVHTGHSEAIALFERK